MLMFWFVLYSRCMFAVFKRKKHTKKHLSCLSQCEAVKVKDKLKKGFTTSLKH